MAKNTEYTVDQKLDFVTRICEMYQSQNATIESCCEAVGITYRSFHLWCAANSDLSDLYKKAKQKQDLEYWENIIRPKAKRALERLIEGEERVETSEDSAPNKDGLMVVKRKRILKSPISPHAAAVIFAMKGEYPDRFADRAQITGKDGAELKPTILTIRYPTEPPQDE